LKEAHEQLGNYAKQVEDLTSIQERNRIAREIHDTVGHKMTALLIQLQLARELVNQKKEEGGPTLEICETIARDALQELRVSVQTLRAEGHESITFQDSVKTLLQEFSSRAQIKTTLKIEGDPSYISTSIQPTLKRMIQESLTNAVRHGKATRCSITIVCREDKISCSIQDNGTGESHVKPGFGLVNMRERVTQHGGQLRVESNPEKGFILSAEFPLRQQQWQLGGAL
jgi:signal transduction histidine kinase